jgi:hypothetical protein
LLNAKEITPKKGAKAAKTVVAEEEDFGDLPF